MKTLLIILLIFIVSNSYACLCDEFNTQKELIESTDYIVQGTVISKSLATYYDTTVVEPTDTIALLFADENGLLINSERVLEIKVRVKKVFKGGITTEIVTIYTSPSSDACGYLKFKENYEYYIYGYDRNYPDVIPNRQNTFWTSKCFGNCRFSEMHQQKLNEYFD